MICEICKNQEFRIMGNYGLCCTQCKNNPFHKLGNQYLNKYDEEAKT